MKRQPKDKQVKLREDHPSYPIISKILAAYRAGKDIKDMMPLKTATRYIYQIYAKKAAEVVESKDLKQPIAPNSKNVSPEQPK